MRKITPFASKFSKHLCNCILFWKSASFQSTGLPVLLVTPQRACLSFLYTLKICYSGKICCELFWGQIEWAGLAVLSANRWSCKLIRGRKSLLWAPGLSPQDVWLNLPEKKKRLKSTAHRKYTGFIFPEIYAICIQHHTQPKQPPENCWGTIEVLHSTT